MHKCIGMCSTWTQRSVVTHCHALLCCFSEGRQCNRGFPLPGRTLFAHCVSVGSGAVLYRVSPAKDCLWKLFIAAAANVVFLSVLGVLKQNYCD